ncbi:uncharacterized protein UV8b_06491 [Ustilaginoidea virens]|uniref:Alpha/beta hydrolase fold-3 domain-containing protein n=1 Tax=Ustilaginoidea virens TaxID=1159556 RepID=A0A8E5HV71_USTVR|nr:uncharacterized protein UV8b_06491 [Ustilaginoidea virens]QUC22250.1 hypothetical protein UV8b_06491 [Ustilaginoidea virens]
MILGPVSILDCLVAGVILAPQLVFTSGVFATLRLLYTALPLLLVHLPFHVISRYVQARDSQPFFIRTSSLFEDVVIRIVRYGFINFPTETLKVFLSKQFAYPLLKWRMFRSGWFTFPARLEEVVVEEGDTSVAGLWIKHDPKREPDVVVYYIHGGGFALGSCYFYLEFLLAMCHLLGKTKFNNPAIFALEYSLVPDQTHPTQVNQAILGYRHVLELVNDASKVCVAGDSAGGTLTLSFLRELGKGSKDEQLNGATLLAVPRLAVLISPWVTLVSSTHYPSRVDYLERGRLWRYGEAYAGSMVQDAAASPGLCEDVHLWETVSPERGYFVVYGEEETLAPDVEAFIRRQRRSNVEVDAMEFRGGVHAWPVASLLLSGTRGRRLQGLEAIVGQIRQKLG